MPLMPNSGLGLRRGVLWKLMPGTGPNKFMGARGARRASNSTYLKALCNLEPLPEQDEYEETLLSSVYFMLDPDAAQIKIGYTTQPVERRLAQIRRERPNVQLLGALRSGYNLERSLHQRFREYRQERNEWYSSEIAAEVLGLLHTEGALAA